MKKTPFLLSAACVMVGLAAGPSAAAPVSSSHFAKDYLVGSTLLNPWNFGLFVKSGERGIEWENGAADTLDSAKIMMVLGYDVFRWILPYGTVGLNESELGWAKGDDRSLEYGAGVRLNLIDQDILDSYLLEDRIRLNANVYYSRSEIEFAGNDVEWSELSVSLTLNVLNEVEGMKAYAPDAVSLFVGPMYSRLKGDSAFNDFEGKDDVGFTAGVEVFLTKRVMLHVSAERFDKTAFTGALNIRF